MIKTVARQLVLMEVTGCGLDFNLNSTMLELYKKNDAILAELILEKASIYYTLRQSLRYKAQHFEKNILVSDYIDEIEKEATSAYAELMKALKEDQKNVISVIGKDAYLKKLLSKIKEEDREKATKAFNEIYAN